MISSILSKLTGVKKTASGWEAKCPHHEDNRQSLSLSVSEGGKVLMHCHAGCSPAEIMNAVGGKIGDLFQPSDKPGIVSTYDYQDEDGTLLMQVVRLFPKSFRQRKPDGNGGWTWKVKDVKKVPFRLPELLSSTGPVFIVEGEKDVLALVALGHVATCNAGGAGKWGKDWAKYFSGRDVILVPDQDDPGRQHMATIRDSLSKVAASIRWIDIADGKDISDWLAKGHTVQELLDRKQDPEIPQTTIEQMMARYAVIYGTSEVWDLVRMESLKVEALRICSPLETKVWLQSPGKRMIYPEDIVFRPQGEKTGQINIFRGLAVRPARKPIPLILEHLANLCNGNPDLIRWVTSWLAYPLQKLGAKMKTSLVIHGGQGVGKNIFFEDLVARIYGQYSVIVDQSTIDEIYTDWLSGKLFIVADEVIANASQGKVKNFLKGVVTGDTVSIRSMYRARRVEENHANIVFLSNNTVPLLIDNDDRRYCVFTADRKFEDDYYSALRGEIDNGGISGFFQYLLDYDLGEFHEHTKPPATQAKRDLSDLCEHPAVRFCKLWAAGDLAVPFATCKSDSLFQAFKLWCEQENEYGRTSKDRFLKELNRLIDRGLIKGMQPGLPRDDDGRRTRAYLIGDKMLTHDFDDRLSEYREAVFKERG